MILGFGASPQQAIFEIDLQGKFSKIRKLVQVCTACHYKNAPKKCPSKKKIPRLIVVLELYAQILFDFLFHNLQSHWIVDHLTQTITLATNIGNGLEYLAFLIPSVNLTLIGWLSIKGVIVQAAISGGGNLCSGVYNGLKL
jgi:hypothetical protein